MVGSDKKWVFQALHNAQIALSHAQRCTNRIVACATVHKLHCRMCNPPYLRKKFEVNCFPGLRDINTNIQTDIHTEHLHTLTGPRHIGLVSKVTLNADLSMLLQFQIYLFTLIILTVYPNFHNNNNNATYFSALSFESWCGYF